jgi:carbon monoxide dehydrogenase subunit G
MRCAQSIAPTGARRHLPGVLLPWRPRHPFPTVHIVIEVNERIEVPAPAHTVWALLSDPHAVVDCVPGATLGEQHEDGSFDATLQVKFGPAKVTFKARVAVEFDETAMTGRVISKGKDNQGGTRFNTSMGFKVVEQADGASSVVPVDAQVEIAGRLASLVESGAALVVKRMTAEFSERIAARCSGENQAREEG